MSDVQVLYLNRDLNEENLVQIENKILNYLANGYSRIILKADELDYIDRSGIGKLVGMKRVVHQLDGDIKLTGISDELKKDFQKTGADKILELYPDLSDAVRSYS